MGPVGHEGARVALQERLQPPGKARERPAQDEDGQAVAPHRDAGEFAAPGVLPDSRERQPERGVAGSDGRPTRSRRRRRARRNRTVRPFPIGILIPPKRETGARMMPISPSSPPVISRAFPEEGEGHHPARKGQHREVDLGVADAEVAYQEREEDRRDDTAATPRRGWVETWTRRAPARRRRRRRTRRARRRGAPSAPGGGCTRRRRSQGA